MAQSFLGLSSDALKKYRSLIISLLFLVLLAVLSILSSLYLSSQYNKAFGRYSAMSTAIDLHHNYIIALENVADTNATPEARAKSAQIAVTTFDQLKKFYPAFLHSGDIQYGYEKPETSHVPAPLDTEDESRAKNLNDKVNNLLLSSHEKPISELRTVTPASFGDASGIESQIRPLTTGEVANWQKGFVIFNSIRDDLQKRAANFDRLNKIITTVSIAALLLYLAAVGLSNLRRLAKADEEIEQARRETDDIMKNVNTGLFLLDKDLKIGNQYSAELEKILGSKEIAGQNLTKLLSNKVSAKDLETTSEFVEQLYNALVREKLLGDLNPLQRIMVVDDKNQSHYLDFKFSRIYHQKNIEKVLVSVQDITTQVKLEQRLEQEREQNSLQVDMLASILNVSPALIDEFIDNTQQNIQKLNAILKQEGASQSDLTEKLNAMYRIMHSLKGEASALKLHNFVKIATNFEEKLKGLQGQSKLSGNEFLPLTIHLDELLQLTSTVDALSKRITENVSHRATKTPNLLAEPVLTNDMVLPVDNVIPPMAQHDTTIPTPVIASNPTPDATVATVATVPPVAPVTPQVVNQISTKAEFYQQLVENVALRQGKKVQLTTTGLDNVVLPKEMETVLKEIMIQLLRNAVVHGIETPSVRLANGKPDTGVINMSLTQTATDYTLSFEDDGRGLNYDSIRERALAMGYAENDIMQWDDNKLISLIFKQGFSTYQADDEDAGRGMGMDIIKARIQELYGKIAINTVTGKFTRFIIKLPKQPNS